MSAKLPPIPEGWVLWDRKIPWESLPKEKMKWWDEASDEWELRAYPEGQPYGNAYIIPGEDAGKALVGIECWVWDDGDKNCLEQPFVIDAGHDGRFRFRYRCGYIGWDHARPTYLGKPGEKNEEAFRTPKNGVTQNCRCVATPDLGSSPAIPEIKLGGEFIFGGTRFQATATDIERRPFREHHLCIEAFGKIPDPTPKPYAFYHLGAESKLFPKGEAPAGWQRLDGREYDAKGAKL